MLTYFNKLGFIYKLYIKGGIKLDYYCFPTETGDTSVFFSLEQYTNSREKAFYSRTQKDINLALQKDKLLLFNLKTKEFIDSNGNHIDIKGKEIFPRCKIQDADLLLNTIEKNGGNSIVTWQDSQTIIHWFEAIKTKRNITCSTLKDVITNIDFYEKKYGKSFFLKTVMKQFSGTCAIMPLVNSKYLVTMTGPLFRDINSIIPDDLTPVLVTNSLSIINDDYGKREWRIFVVKNEILCVSRLSNEPVTIESNILKKIKAKVKQISKISNFPSSYCVDFFEYEHNGEIIFDICEFNPIESAGRYGNNDFIF